MIALIGLAGLLLLPLVNDYVAARREKIKERTRMREAEAESAMKSLRDALDAKDALIEDLREDRNQWRSLHLASQDGWYGQRRRT